MSFVKNKQLGYPLSGSFTGSFTGTFSGSVNGTLSGSITSASYAQTASYVLQAVSSSFATSASYALSSSYAISSSTALQANTASYALTASYAISSSYSKQSDTASSVLGGIPRYLALWSGSNYLSASSIYQTASTIVINQTGYTSANPEALYVWQPSTSSFNVISGKGNLNNYLQLNIQNTNAGNIVSSDIVATSNNGDENNYYVDLGINGQNYNGNVGSGPGFSNDGYLYNVGNDFYIGNYTDGKSTYFFNGLGGDHNPILTLAPNSNAYISSSLIVTGSILAKGGITGSLFGTSSYSSQGLSASYAATSSYANNFTASNVLVTGTLTAQTLIVQTITASQEYSSGSNVFGNSLSNRQVFTGSVLMTGSLTVYGNEIVSGSVSSTLGFTGSLLGTASQAITASYVLNSVSASYATTASWAVNSSASLVSISSSYSYSSSNAISSSFAQTASYSLSGNGFPFSGSAIITGSLLISGSQTITGSLSISGSTGNLFSSNADTLLISGSLIVTGSTSITGSLSVSGSITGSIFGTASQATSASNAITSSFSQTSSYSLSASYAQNSSASLVSISSSYSYTASSAISSSFSQTASYVLNASSFPYTGSAKITGSLILTGSFNITGSTLQSGDNTLLGKTLLSGSLTVSGSQGVFPYNINIYGDTSVNGNLQFLPVSSNINSSISASYIFVSGSTQDLYFSQNGAGYANTTRLRWLEGNLYTGLFNGGVITSQSSTVYQVGSGSGIIVNMNANIASNPYPTIQYLNWPNLSASIAPLSASYDQSFVSIQYASGAASIYVQGTPYVAGQFDTLISIGVVTHNNHSTISAVKTQPTVAYGWKQRSSVFSRAFGPLKLSGFSLSPSGSSTGSLVIGSGTAYQDGANYTVDPNNPAYVSADQGTNVSKIWRYYQSGSGTNNWVYDTNNGAGYLSIDPARYSNNGVLTTVPAGFGGNWTIQRVYWFPNSATKAIIVYYGNAYYTDQATATAAINVENFTEAPNTAANAIYLGSLIVKNNANFTNSATYAIVPGGLFRSIGGISGGSGNVTAATLAGLSDVNITEGSGIDQYALMWNNATSKWIASNSLGVSITGNAQTATSASYATSASFALIALSGTGSFSGSFSGSLIGTSSYALTAVSSSYALTASYLAGYVSPFPYSGSAQITGSLGLTGSLSVSGSAGTVFSSNADTLLISGSLIVTGSTIITGSLNVSAGITGSHFGTSSYATQAATASYILNVVSSSYALTSSFSTNSQTASYVTTAQTASYILNAVSSSYALTSSFSTNSQTASYAAAYLLTSSFASFSSSYNTGSFTGSFVGVFTGSLLGIASQAVSSSYAVNSSNAISSSYALTSSFATNFTASNILVNGTLTAQTLVIQTITASQEYSSGSNVFGSNLTNTQVFTGSVSITGSLNVNNTSVILSNQTASMSVATASYATVADSAVTSSYANATAVNGFSIGGSSIYYSTVNSSISGLNNLFTLSTGSFTAGTIQYTAFNGANSRAGQVIASWNSNNTQYTDFSTPDIGDTTQVTMSVSIVSSQVQFNVQTNTSGWKIKSQLTLI